MDTGAWFTAGRVGVTLAVLLAAAACDKGAPAPSARPPTRVQATTTGGPGEAAEYVYDPAGNLLQIRTPVTPAAISIAGFYPPEGGPGEIVTVFGSGFDPTPSQDSVLFGGVAAAVLWATYSELTVAVPGEATTGPISVTTSAGTATSAGAFTVVSGVVVSDFSPRMGRVGTVITVEGFNFDPTPSEDSVYVGGGPASVTSASYTALLATVGSASTSGKISVTTAAGTGVSADDFFLLPVGYVASAIGFAGRAVEGSPTSVAISQAGDAGLVLFDGTQGHFVSLYVSGSTLAGSTLITVLAPSGASFFSRSVSGSGEYKLEPPALPVTGTYTVVVQPRATSTGVLSLQVLHDASAVLQAGTASPMALAQGQNGRYTLSGSAGDRFGLACTSLSTTPSGSSLSLNIYRPDGTYLWGVSTVTIPTSFQLPQLPITGDYTIRVQPAGTAAASLTLLLSHPSEGTIVVDDAATQFQNSSPGQAGRYVFLGNAGDFLGLAATALTVTPAGGYVYFSISKPDGTPFWNSSSPGPNSWQLPQLPTTGTYTLSVQPPGTATASVTLLLSRPITGLLATDGTPTTYQTARAGQSGRYTFTGTAGQRYTMQATAGGGLANSISVTVYQPSGASIGYISLT